MIDYAKTELLVTAVLFVFAVDIAAAACMSRHMMMTLLWYRERTTNKHAGPLFKTDQGQGIML